ncbi:hypothetical protein H9649_08495 [Sporosarcina sp. Sa2YVA2]|uniref:Lipoprotein n=1 Tax=Sporosarcina quadrami TaxID=2762234 RepID=A0ABR8U9B6_9BACL|nr:hypothetical protein [Sporosarcina quadrami]MBD7984616.1 hypothetical protein [Sporosarcina quadrami]
MFKKAIPLALVSGLVLAGCGGNDNVPSNNETPMESLDNGLRDMTPKVNNGAGPDMDGMNDGLDSGNDVHDGIMNDNNRNNGSMDGMDKTNDGIMDDTNVNGTDDSKMNRDKKDGMNNR